MPGLIQRNQPTVFETPTIAIPQFDTVIPVDNQTTRPSSVDYGLASMYGNAAPVDYSSIEKRIEPILNPIQQPKEPIAASVPVKNTKDYEGFRGKVYTDTTGNATVGYGHKLTKAEIASGIYKNGITQKQAEALYNMDHSSHSKSFFRKEPWAKDMNSYQQKAMIDMAFNLGPNWMDKFPSVRKYMQDGNFTAAADVVRGSLYRKQVGQRALDNATRLESK